MKILVPVDFSDISKNAASYAIELGKPFKAEIFLLHVYDVPVAVSDFPVVVANVEDLEKVNTHLVEKLITELKKKHGDDILISGSVKMGFVVDEIKSEAEDKKVDLIVMGITGAGKVTELLIGSNATRVVKKLNYPTIIVPQDAKYHAIKRILFACDYTNIEESKAIDKLIEFVKLLEAKLVVLNIGEHHKHHEYSKELAGRLLEYIFENANETIDIPGGINYSVHKRKDNDIEHGINHFAEKHKADLLVMIPRKHNVLLNLFQESNTKKMAFHSHIPILALHEEGK